MKKIGLVLLGFALIFSADFSAAQKKEPLRVDSEVFFEAGDNYETRVLTDADGLVFVEFPAGLVAMNAFDRTRFTGEVLPPNVVAIPAKTPRTRMRELLTFEILSDSGDMLVFTDKITTLNERNRARLAILEPEKVVSGPRVKIVQVIPDFSVQKPELWQFLSEEEGWQYIGGTVDVNEEYQVFSAKIYTSGIYSIIDANPLPVDSADDYKIPATIESLTEQIERLEAQKQTLLAEQFGYGDDELPPFLSDEADDELTDEEFLDELDGIDSLDEIPGLESDLSVEVPGLDTGFTQEDDKTREIPAFDESAGFTDEELDELFYAELEEAGIEGVAEPYSVRLPTAGQEKSSNFFLYVFGGVLLLIGGAVWLTVKSDPYK